MDLVLFVIFMLCILVILIPGQAVAQYAGGPLMDASIPYVGADLPVNAGYNGSGITVAIIDTGVDFTHPDLADIGKRSSNDIDGHGTQVIGIIAANGSLNGIVPGVSVLSYKISEDGIGVSAKKIISAIEKAIAEGVDVVNISLGVNRTNANIDAVITRAAAAGVLIVSAAGNDGPKESSIGSPGINPNSITVGATYNNVSSSIVASLNVNGEYFNAAPMVGTISLNAPIEAEIVFGGYAKESDLQGTEYNGSIVLAERGSDIPKELIYFTEKEAAASNAGAIAIIVYNNVEGMFLGDLQHNNTDLEYKPNILIVSISREDGLKIKEYAEKKAIGRLDTFLGIDTVTHFSSRGPVSPFYIKPDLVAPGAYINTTSTGGGYEIASGTSFSAPHVTGVAIALLDKNPNLTPTDIRSIISTTADASSSSIYTEGSGRLNVTRAFMANMITTPHHLVLHISPVKPAAIGSILLQPIDGVLGEISASAEISDGAEIKIETFDNRIMVNASSNSSESTTYYGRILINDGTVEYGVPVMVMMTNGSMNVEIKDGTLDTQIVWPNDWSYARIMVENPFTGWTNTITAKPDLPIHMHLPENGTYWVSATIDSTGRSYEAYAIVETDTLAGIAERSEIPNIPIDVIAIAIFTLAILYMLFRITKR
ncbi:MAG: peptidase S8/S53 subtilisin kexin sedolisin (vpr) [Cenarchaeum symbiont of Oopsacas minuta]|nr:peptidase S8/S53 subtilisin kexin sedolisin (vpr) [Cenarchaeum symbiont of Oopsacas minuta]